jgi:hypothetical protein
MGWFGNDDSDQGQAYDQVGSRLELLVIARKEGFMLNFELFPYSTTSTPTRTSLNTRRRSVTSSSAVLLHSRHVIVYLVAVVQRIDVIV